jgi:hypothetical protein
MLGVTVCDWGKSSTFNWLEITTILVYTCFTAARYNEILEILRVNGNGFQTAILEAARQLSLSELMQMSFVH